jgi:hypothetical protein
LQLGTFALILTAHGARHSGRSYPRMPCRCNYGLVSLPSVDPQARWFGRYLRNLVGIRSEKTLLSTRNPLDQRCRAAGISESFMI